MDSSAAAHSSCSPGNCLSRLGIKLPARNGCHTRWEDCFLTLFVHRRTDEAHSGCFHSWAQRRPCCLYPLGAPTHHPLSHPFRPRRIYLQITLQEVTSKDEIFMLDLFGYIRESVNMRELGYYCIWVYSRATSLPCSYCSILSTRLGPGQS